MLVQFHPGAKFDLASADDWYETQRPGLATELEAAVDRALVDIVAAPLAWPRWLDIAPELGVRRYVLRRFPFALAFTVEAERIVVLAVAHAKRSPEYWLSRATRP